MESGQEQQFRRARGIRHRLRSDLVLPGDGGDGPPARAGHNLPVNGLHYTDVGLHRRASGQTYRRRLPITVSGTDDQTVVILHLTGDAAQQLAARRRFRSELSIADGASVEPEPSARAP